VRCAYRFPLGRAAGGFPVAVQLAARYGEATLFRLSGQLERARPWFEPQAAARLLTLPGAAARCRASVSAPAMSAHGPP
jgi:amidase